MKGGIELARQSVGTLAADIGLTLVLGVLLTVIAFAILRGIGRLDRSNAAAVAAHYGSVSVGTFAVAVAYVASEGIAYEAQLPLLLVVLEVPAIILGILFARGLKAGAPWSEIGREVLLGRSVLLLLGGLVIGGIAGPTGIEPLTPLFFDLFKGILALFLLEMGLIAADHLGGFRRHGAFMVAFALLIPPFFAMIGAVFGMFMGLSVGGTLLLATLAASASYIAAPAAMRSAVPEANPALSLTAALAITFPFNILLGIPLYQRGVEWLLGGSP